MANIDDLALTFWEKSEEFKPKRGFNMHAATMRLLLEQNPYAIEGLHQIYDELKVADIPQKELTDIVGAADGSSSIGWPFLTQEGRVFVSFTAEAAYRPQLANAVQPKFVGTGVEILPQVTPLDALTKVDTAQKDRWIDFAKTVALKSGVTSCYLHEEQDFALGLYFPGDEPEMVLDVDPKQLVTQKDDDFNITYGGRKGLALPLILDSKNLYTHESLDQQVILLQEFQDNLTNAGQRQTINGYMLCIAQQQKLQNAA